MLLLFYGKVFIVYLEKLYLLLLVLKIQYLFLMLLQNLTFLNLPLTLRFHQHPFFFLLPFHLFLSQLFLDRLPFQLRSLQFQPQALNLPLKLQIDHFPIFCGLLELKDL